MPPPFILVYDPHGLLVCPDSANRRAYSGSSGSRRRPNSSAGNRPAPYYQRRRSEPARHPLRLLVDADDAPEANTRASRRSAILVSPSTAHSIRRGNTVSPRTYAMRRDASSVQLDGHRFFMANAPLSGPPRPQRATFIHPDIVLNNPFSTPCAAFATGSRHYGPTRGSGRASNPGTSDVVLSLTF